MGEYAPGTNVRMQFSVDRLNTFAIHGMVIGPADPDVFPPDTVEVEWNIDGQPMFACAATSDLKVE